MKKARKIAKEVILLPSTTDRERIHELDIGLIGANTSQPRKNFDSDHIIKLADSIRRYGIIQPLTVRRIQPRFGYCYELVAGERRLRAAKMLGLKTVPCIISEVNEAISAEIALVENMLRENLGMFEQAAAFAHLSQKFGLKQEEIAAKMSLSQSAVANKMRLLRLTPEEQTLITDAELTERHARAFLRIGNKQGRILAIHHVIDHELNVAETDKYITAILSHETTNLDGAKTAKDKEALCNNLDKYIEKLQNGNDWITVNRSASDTETIIILTLKKEA